MKKLLLMVSFMALAAGSAMAADPVGGTGGLSPDPVSSPAPLEDVGNRDDQPVRPVPEPGTMALASMGLIALGAAARGRKTSK